jgi:FMN-dependent oxidoreductase (nitrilotriacetate monooxygenase family)
LKRPSSNGSRGRPDTAATARQRACREFVDSGRLVFLDETLTKRLFFADRLAVSEQLSEGRDTAFRYGAQDAARLYPIPVLAFLAGKTSKIGLGGTRSTTYFEPNHVARSFATLDHLSNGRAAWNVVTSMNDSEGRIFGKEAHLGHDLRYERADEFVEVTLALWHSWSRDALIHDKGAGLFADPAKISSLHHVGKWFKVDGPLNIPQSPRGHPVIIQAGSSGRGRRFGARWAEAIFTINRTMNEMVQFRSTIHGEMAAFGRAPETCKVLTAVMLHWAHSRGGGRETCLPQ